MTNTRSRSARSKQSRRERRIAAAKAPAGTRVRPRDAVKVYNTGVDSAIQSRAAVKIYNTPSADSAVQSRDGVKVYNTPPVKATRATTAARRSYLPEPAPVDYTTEYRFVQHDLRRIFFWAILLLLAMLALWLLPIF
jgi:hypothetical protein